MPNYFNQTIINKSIIQIMQCTCANKGKQNNLATTKCQQHGTLPAMLMKETAVTGQTTKNNWNAKLIQLDDN